MPALRPIEWHDKRVKIALERTQKATRSLRPAFAASGVLIESSISKNFREEGRPDKWKPLVASTITGKIKKFGGRTKRGKLRAATKRKLAKNKVLFDTGNLSRSITSEATNHHALVGSSLKYAATHHYGDRKRNIPARPFVLIQDEDFDRIAKIFERHLTEANWR